MSGDMLSGDVMLLDNLIFSRDGGRLISWLPDGLAKISRNSIIIHAVRICKQRVFFQTKTFGYLKIF
jgi:hypothetical protein